MLMATVQHRHSCGFYVQAHNRLHIISGALNGPESASHRGSGMSGAADKRMLGGRVAFHHKIHVR